jgi:hypothetical protein
MSGEYLSVLTERFEKGPAEFQRTLLKYTPENPIVNPRYRGPAHYNPLLGGIKMNIASDKSGVIFFHENGHLIDGATGFRVSGDKEFAARIADDYENAAPRPIRYGAAFFAIEGRCVPDLYAAMSQNRRIARALRPEGYWEAPEMVCREAFAHFFEAAFDRDERRRVNNSFPLSNHWFIKAISSL